MNDQHQPVCFAIMPFTVREADLAKYQNDPDHWREVYQGLIVPAIKQAGLQVQRDDEDYSTRLVGEGIWSKIEHADLILCDLSSHNPNVHLELGWAMRADKRIVLIKDDVTAFNFDLNQYYTYEYSSRLQPTILHSSISDLAKVILSTLKDDVSNYSMISKLALRQRAVDAASDGSIEVELLQELLSEVHLLKRQPLKEQVSYDDGATVFLDVPHVSKLPEKLEGSTWRKKNGLEEIFFVSDKLFVYSSVGTQQWWTNDVSFDGSGSMVLRWRQDGFKSYCRFDPMYSQFTEQNGERWLLVAREPYIHPSFPQAK
jgi:hypothetical protein